MKKLVVLVGPNGVGKSTAAKEYVEQNANTAYVDSDWCRVINPFVFTDSTKKTVTDNLYCLLRNYLFCDDVHTVVFTHSWHGGRKEIYDSVIGRLQADGIGFKEIVVILRCSLEENVRRALADGRDKSRVQRGMDATFSFYDGYVFPQIDTTNLIPRQVAGAIHNIVEAF